MKPWLRYGLIGLALLVVATWVAVWAVARSWRADFDEEVRRLEQGGAATRASQLAPAAIPDEENSALLLAEAARLFGQLEKPDWDLLESEETEIAALESCLTAQRKVLEKIEEALRRPRCRYSVDYLNESWIENKLISQIIGFSRLLCMRATVSLRGGQSDAAARDLRLILRLSDTLAGEPLLISQLVRYVVQEKAFELLKRDQLKLSPEGWRELGAAFERHSFGGDLGPALEMERAMALRLCYERFFHGEIQTSADMSKTTYWGLGLFAPKAATYHLRVMARVIDLARKPYAEARPAELKLKNEVQTSRDWHQLLTNILTPAFLRVHSNEARAEAIQRMSVAFCRLKAEGRAPDSLEIIDPFSGMPLSYRRDGSGFELHSFGDNQKDDNGEEDDLVLRSPK